MKGRIAMSTWSLLIKHDWCGLFRCFDIFANTGTIGGSDDGVEWLFEKLDRMPLTVWRQKTFWLKKEAYWRTVDDHVVAHIDDTAGICKAVHDIECPWSRFWRFWPRMVNVDGGDGLWRWCLRGGRWPSLRRESGKLKQSMGWEYTLTENRPWEAGETSITSLAVRACSTVSSVDHSHSFNNLCVRSVRWPSTARVYSAKDILYTV